MYKDQKLKKEVLNEIKVASMFQKHSLFLNFEEYYYATNHLVLIYEEFTKYSMSKLKEKIKVDIFVLLIFRDLVEIIWILKENNLFHTLVTHEIIYLKNGYFKIGGFQHIVPYGTKNECIAHNVQVEHLQFMPPEYFLNQVMFYPSQIFMIGTLLYQFIFKEFPINQNFDQHRQFKEFYQNHKVFQYPPNQYCFDQNILTLIKECIQIDYNNRIRLRYLKTLVEDYVKEVYSNNLLQLRKTIEVKQNEKLMVNTNLSQSMSKYNYGSQKSFKGSIIASSKKSIGTNRLKSQLMKFS